MLKYSLLIILLATIVSSCFITNCPSGGKKRSGNSGPTRECERCGGRGFGGRCFGPGICCSAAYGCLIGTIESSGCGKEDVFPNLCRNPGPPCSGGNLNIKGQCAAEGICCSTDVCGADENCVEEAKPKLPPFFRRRKESERAETEILNNDYTAL